MKYVHIKLNGQYYCEILEIGFVELKNMKFHFIHNSNKNEGMVPDPC